MQKYSMRCSWAYVNRHVYIQKNQNVCKMVAIKPDTSAVSSLGNERKNHRDELGDNSCSTGGRNVNWWMWCLRRTTHLAPEHDSFSWPKWKWNERKWKPPELKWWRRREGMTLLHTKDPFFTGTRTWVQWGEITVMTP